MSNPSKARGGSFELLVARYLAFEGFPAADRAFGAGRAKDVGDIAGVAVREGKVVIECKVAKMFDLAGWMTETAKEKENANAALGVLVVKRRMKPVEESFAIVTLADLAWLLREASR